jgi:hypothetical protein
MKSSLELVAHTQSNVGANAQFVWEDFLNRGRRRRRGPFGVESMNERLFWARSFK